jgi:hypothetical protein
MCVILDKRGYSWNIISNGPLVIKDLKTKVLGIKFCNSFL